MNHFFRYTNGLTYKDTNSSAYKYWTMDNLLYVITEELDRTKEFDDVVNQLNRIHDELFMRLTLTLEGVLLSYPTHFIYEFLTGPCSIAVYKHHNYLRGMPDRILEHYGIKKPDYIHQVCLGIPNHFTLTWTNAGAVIHTSNGTMIGLTDSNVTLLLDDFRLLFPNMDVQYYD